MRARTSAITGLIVVWAAAASAQPWREAYDRKDYPTAASLLQADVFEHVPHGGSRYPDVQAIQTLARMYAEGRGIPQDGLMACALSNLGSGAAVYQYGDRDPRTLAIQSQVETHCVPLSAAERREAMDAGGCFRQPPAPQVLLESPARSVELGRSRLTIVSRGDTQEYALAPLIRCAQQVPLARYVRVPAPRGSRLGAREFVELYSWHSATKEGQRVRTLEWSVVELTPQAPMLRARTILERGEGSAWPARPVPPEFSSGATFSMHKSGGVRWKMSSSLHGVIGRPGTLRARR